MFIKNKFKIQCLNLLQKPVHLIPSKLPVCWMFWWTSHVTLTINSCPFFGVFPSQIKTAILKPPPKKPSFNHSNLNNKSKHSDDSHSSTKLQKSLLVMSLIYTSHTKHIVLDLFEFNVCRNYAPLNYSGQESTKTICSFWFWHTSNLEIRSRSSNLVWIAKPQARL